MEVSTSILFVFGISLLVFVLIRDTLRKKLIMNYLVIKQGKILEMEAKYGKEMVEKCLALAGEEHPKFVYDKIKEEADLSECFYCIFEELIK